MKGMGLSFTHFFKSYIDIRLPTGLITEFPSFVKIKFPRLNTVPSKLLN